MRENWIEIELEKFSYKITDGSHNPPKKQNSGLPMLSATNVLDDNIVFDNYRLISENEFEKEYNRANVEIGDVLLTIVGTIGRSSVVPENTKKFTLQRSVALIKPILVNSKYVSFGLRSPVSQSFFKKESKGTAQKGIYLNAIRKLKLPIAPLPEQRTIVGKIEQLFSELDNGIANLKAAKDKLEIYRQAVLKKAFEGEFTSKWREGYSGQTASELYQKIKEQREELYTQKIDDWILIAEQAELKGNKKPPKPKKPIIGAELDQDEIVEYSITPRLWHLFRFIDLIKYEENGIKRGPFGSAIKKAFFVPRGYKVYEQQNAINDNSSLGTYYLDDKKYKELIKFSVKGGDYIVSCSGTIGRIHKLSMECEPGVINQALLKIVLDEELMHSKYFLYLFRSEVFQRRILKGTRGTGMQNLASVDEIKELIIQLPPIEEQLQIIQEIESRLSVCDNILANIEEGMEKSEALRQSILKQAFEGKLLNEEELEACRKEPDWEPAKQLLERIRNEQKVKIKNGSYAG